MARSQKFISTFKLLPVFLKIEWLPSYHQPNFGVLAKIVMSECDKSHIRER